MFLKNQEIPNFDNIVKRGVTSTLDRVLSLNFQLFQKKLILAHLKALNKRISEWVCFLSLDKRFQRYSNFCIYLKKLGLFGILSGGWYRGI